MKKRLLTILGVIFILASLSTITGNSNSTVNRSDYSLDVFRCGRCGRAVPNGMENQILVTIITKESKAYNIKSIKDQKKTKI